MSRYFESTMKAQVCQKKRARQMNVSGGSAQALPHEIMFIVADTVAAPNVRDRQYQGPTVHNVMVRFRSMMALCHVNREWHHIMLHPFTLPRWRDILNDFLHLRDLDDFNGRDLDAARNRIERDASSAPRVLSLVLGTGCQLCGARRVRKVYWEMGGDAKGVRCCRACLYANTVGQYHLVHEMMLDRIYPDLRQAVLPALPCRQADFFVPGFGGGNVVTNTFFWSNDVLAALGLPRARSPEQARATLAQPWQDACATSERRRTEACEQLRALIANHIEDPPPSAHPPSIGRAKRACCGEVPDVFGSSEQMRARSPTFRRLTDSENAAHEFLVSSGGTDTRTTRLILGQITRSIVSDALFGGLQRLVPTTLQSAEGCAETKMTLGATVALLVRTLLRKKRTNDSDIEASPLPLRDDEWFLHKVWRAAPMLPVRRREALHRVRALFPRVFDCPELEKYLPLCENSESTKGITVLERAALAFSETELDRHERSENDGCYGVFAPCVTRLREFLLHGEEDTDKATTKWLDQLETAACDEQNCRHKLIVQAQRTRERMEHCLGHWVPAFLTRKGIQPHHMSKIIGALRETADALDQKSLRERRFPCIACGSVLLGGVQGSVSHLTSTECERRYLGLPSRACSF